MAAVNDIIIQGMREAGQFTITTSQQAFTDFKNYQWPTIKGEIWNACRTDRLLEGELFKMARKGYSAIDLASVTDFDNETNVYLYDMSESFRGTVQAVSGADITLNPTFSAEESSLIGAYVFIADSSGNTRGHRPIIVYNNSTKVASMVSSIADVIAGDKYYIQQLNYPLYRDDYVHPGMINGRPVSYSRRGTSFYINPHPDKDYPILFTYRQNLTLLDETSTAFLNHLTMRRHLWVQGVKVKTMARYDDDRYGAEKQIWEQMLAQYAGQNKIYRQMLPSR
jgi:hypothetical protein